MTDQIDNNTSLETINNTTINTANNESIGAILSTSNTPSIPDKFKVIDETTGSVDYQATLAKLSESYTGLEKRIGTSDLPPKTVDDYKLEEREGFNFDEFKADESNQAFLKAAHSKGITNSQLDFLISEYDKRAVDLISSTSQINTDDVVGTLQSEWGSNYESNIFNAVKAAKACGITDEQINDPSIGNNVAFIKMAAYFGSQLQEDKSINVGVPVAEDISSLMRSEAYFNDKHPEHKATKAKIDAYYNSLRK